MRSCAQYFLIVMFVCVLSGHPLAMAAGIATLEVYEEQGVFANAAKMSKYFQEGLHSLKGLLHVVDIRNCGMLGGLELAQVPGLPTKRSMDVLERCYKKGLYIRTAGPSMTISPPLVANEAHIDRLVSTLGDAIVESSKEMK